MTNDMIVAYSLFINWFIKKIGCNQMENITTNNIYIFR